MSSGVIFRRYKPGDEEGIAKVLRACFSNYDTFGLDADYWLSYSKIDPGIRTENSLVAEHDGKVVGHLQLVERRIKVADDSFVAMGGIANVSVVPEMRSKGISTRLMNNALGMCRQLGYPISCLFTSYSSPAHRIYERLGYGNTLMCGDWSIGTAEDMKRLRERCGNIREVRVRNYEKGDEEGKLGVYREWCRPYTGVVERSRDYWERKLVTRSSSETFFYEEFDPNEVLVGLENGKITSYVYMTYWKNKRRPFRDKDTASIRELAFLPGSNRSLVKLTGETMDKLLSEGTKLCEAYLPNDEPYLTLFDPFKRIPLPSWWDHVYMVHVPLLRKLFEEIRGDLEERLGRTTVAGSNTVLALQTPYGEVTLKISGGELSLDDGNPSARVTLDADSFTRMIFGIETTETILGKCGVTITTSEPIGKIVSVLLALFPRRTWHTCPVDQW
jgi:predicted N-acetyltransferase YhbS